MTPEAFEVNRTWLAFRINQRPIESGDGAHDIFVLQDAGSMFIFGTALAPADADGPLEQTRSACSKGLGRIERSGPKSSSFPAEPPAEVPSLVLQPELVLS